MIEEAIIAARDAMRRGRQRDVLWFNQKDVCNRCGNMVVSSPSARDRAAGVRVMRCAAVEHADLPHRGRVGYVGLAYCIDARDQGSPCGPEANLFQEL